MLNINPLAPSGLSVAPVHPEWQARIFDWNLMRHFQEGEAVVKALGATYLPPTSGEIANGCGKGGASNVGDAAYQARKTRAVVPPLVAEGVLAHLGALHHKDPILEVPTGVEPFLARATYRRESIYALARDINRHQLIEGRCAVLLDVPSGTTISAMPYACVYPAQALINWRTTSTPEGEQLQVAQLDESGFYQSEPSMEWVWQTKYRWLVLRDGVYQVAVSESPTLPPADGFMTPTHGGRALDRIPLTIVNSSRLGVCTEPAPLLGLAHQALAIYRMEADYRQSLFLTGQDTLVVSGRSGEDSKVQVGSGAVLDVPLNGDAKYIGVSGQGLAEMRQALDNDRRRAAQMAGQLDRRGADAESGEALRLRIGAQTTMLTSLATTAGEGLEEILRNVARWVGADPTKVSVLPNLDFVDEPPPSLRDLMDAKMKGLPLSMESIHHYLRRNELTELTFEEEVHLLEEERTTFGTMGATDTDIDPAGGEDDDDERGDYPQ